MSGSRHYKKFLPKGVYPPDDDYYDDYYDGEYYDDRYYDDGYYDDDYYPPKDLYPTFQLGQSSRPSQSHRVRRQPKHYGDAAEEMWCLLEGLEAIGSTMDKINWRGDDRFEMLLDHVEFMAEELSTYGPNVKKCYCVLCTRGFSEALAKDAHYRARKYSERERKLLKKEILEKLRVDYMDHKAKKKAMKEWKAKAAQAAGSSRASPAPLDKTKKRDKGKNPYQARVETDDETELEGQAGPTKASRQGSSQADEVSSWTDMKTEEFSS